MAKTIYHANSVLTTLKTSGVFIGLLTAEPTSATDYTEVTGVNYARASVPSASWTTPAGGTMQNVSDVTITGNLYNKVIQYVGLFDASTGGNLLRYYRVAHNEWVIDTAYSLVIGAGNLKIRER